MSTRFTRPAGTYDSTSVTTNMTKYRADSAATPKVAISSAKMDGDFNTVIDALNALDDDINGLVAGSVPDGSITAAKLSSDAVTTAKILDANVTTAKIAPQAVDATLLASNAVTTAKILDANVTEGKLANAAVTANKIAADAVTTVKILDSNVTTAKIADDAVTFSKIQNMTTARLLGRTTASSGDIEEISVSGLTLASGVLTNPAKFTESFVSSEQTIPAAAGLVDVAHSMTGAPTLVQLRIICKTAENGYSVGDEVILPDQSTNGASTINPTAIIDDTTNVYVRFGSPIALNIVNKNTGAAVTLTSANWKLIIRAWR